MTATNSKIANPYCDLPLCRPQEDVDGDPLGHTYESVGGLFATEAIDLLKDFYEQGNPNGEVLV